MTKEQTAARTEELRVLYEETDREKRKIFASYNRVKKVIDYTQINNSPEMIKLNRKNFRKFKVIVEKYNDNGMTVGNDFFEAHKADIGADIIPYQGAGGFSLYSEYSPEMGGKFVDLNEAFFRIEVHNSVWLFYAKPNMKMFKIVLNTGYLGTMNGINPLGKSEDELYELYPGLWFDDFEELFFTDPEQGFFFETDPVTRLTTSVMVYIKEMEDNDFFFKYEW